MSQASEPLANSGAMTDAQQSAVKNILTQHKEMPGALLPILHTIQDTLSYVPEAAVADIALALNLSRAEVHGVISFYHFFRTQEPGKYVLEICRAESCQAVGGRQLEAQAKAALDIDWHQTTRDGQITLEPIYCLGNCACSPSVRVGKEVYGRIDEEGLTSLIDTLSQDRIKIMGGLK